MAESKPSPRRWWSRLRFSLRVLMVLVVLVSGGLTWMVTSARRQRVAVAAIQKAGGRVLYNWEWKDGNRIPGGAPWVPEWLVDQIGIDYFGSVVFVDLTGTNADPALAHVKELRRVEWLLLINSKVSDTALAHLEGLGRLKWLDLSYNPIGDEGVVHLKGLRGLEVLFLHNTNAGDSGLEHLNGLKNLRTLTLDHTRIRGLTCLQGLVNLQSLHLGHSAISDHELSALARLTNLRWLSAPGQSLTDSAVQELQEALPKLRVVR